MNTPHTSGPWTIGRGYASTHATPIRKDGENLAWVCGTDSPHQFTPEQIAANARLIAAAPDLLRVLVDLRKELRANRKMNVKKDFSLMAADAAAGTIIHNITGTQNPAL